MALVTKTFFKDRRCWDWRSRADRILRFSAAKLLGSFHDTRRASGDSGIAKGRASSKAANSLLRVATNWEMPSEDLSPSSRERVSSGFARCRASKTRLIG